MTKPIVLTIEIDREPDDVFAYTSDYRNEAEWQDNVLELTCEPPDGPVTVGTRIHKVRKTPMGRQAFTIEVTELDSHGRHHSDLVIDGSFAGTTGQWRVQPSHAGSRLELIADFNIRGALKLLAPMIRRVAARDLQNELLFLKRHLESKASR